MVVTILRTKDIQMNNVKSWLINQAFILLFVIVKLYTTST